MPAFFKTHRDGKSWMHLAHSAGQDFALCGEDTVGDESLDEKPPESLGEKRRHRVTCPHCLAIIDTCRDYLRHNAKVRHARANEDTAPSVGQTTENP